MSGSPANAPATPTRQVVVGGNKVIGAKHRRDGRPCQDDIRFAQRGATITLAVADGHGSSRHADVGAQIAVDVASEQLLAFAGCFSEGQLVDPQAVHRFAQDPFRVQLVREWARRVREHAQGEAVELEDYGSTLLFALVTPEFMLIGQLGDGDVLLVDAAGSVSRPLPTDPACFGEETPSLCQPEAWASLRVLALPTPDAEALLIVSTDGYSKSYATDADFELIGPDYLEMVRELELSGVVNHLEEFLTEVTTRGSGDDVTLGLIYLPPAAVAQAAAPSLTGGPT